MEFPQRDAGVPAAHGHGRAGAAGRLRRLVLVRRGQGGVRGGPGPALLARLAQCGNAQFLPFARATADAKVHFLPDLYYNQTHGDA